MSCVCLAPAKTEDAGWYSCQWPWLVLSGFSANSLSLSLSPPSCIFWPQPEILAVLGGPGGPIPA